MSRTSPSQQPEARRAYQRAYRAADPGRRALERRANAARVRAWVRLADEYPEAFILIHNEERASQDLPPIGTGSTGRPPKTKAAQSS